MKNRMNWSLKRVQKRASSVERANGDVKFELFLRRAAFLASFFGAILKVDTCVSSHGFVLTDDVNLRFLCPDDQKTKPKRASKKNEAMLGFPRSRVEIARQAQEVSKTARFPKKCENRQRAPVSQLYLASFGPSRSSSFRWLLSVSVPVCVSRVSCTHGQGKRL